MSAPGSIVVVGGGISGTAAAIALRRLGSKALPLEPGMRSALRDFGGLAAWARERIVDPELVDARAMETVLVPAPRHRDRVVLVGDAAHATAPHLAAGAAIGLEDGLVPAEELAADPGTSGVEPTRLGVESAQVLAQPYRSAKESDGRLQPWRGARLGA